MNPEANAPLAGATGSDDIEAAVLRHLRDIRDLEKQIGGDPMAEWLAVEMAWSRWAATIPNEDLAGLVHYIIERYVKPHNLLWAQLREITIRLSEHPKAKRAPRRKRPNSGMSDSQSQYTVGSAPPKTEESQSAS